MIHEEKEPEQIACGTLGIKRVDKMRGKNGTKPHYSKGENYASEFF